MNTWEEGIPVGGNSSSHDPEAGKTWCFQEIDIRLGRVSGRVV